MDRLPGDKLPPASGLAMTSGTGARPGHMDDGRVQNDEGSATPTSRAAGRHGRPGLVSLDWLTAAGALGGGLGLIAGLEARRFRVEWLSGTPFDRYLGPGLILAGTVGGSAAIAAAATRRDAQFGGKVALFAGIVLRGWIGDDAA